MTSFLALAHDFPRHPKVARLGPPAKRWIWVTTLCYCAEYRTRGYVAEEALDVIPGATVSFMKTAVQVGLARPVPGGWIVHDWDEFNGTKREREMARERKRQQRLREAENTPPSHADVTEPSVTSHNQTPEDVTPRNVTSHESDRDKTGEMSRSRARAPSPSPLPTNHPPPSTSVADPQPPPLEDGRTDINYASILRDIP